MTLERETADERAGCCVVACFAFLLVAVALFTSALFLHERDCDVITNLQQQIEQAKASVGKPIIMDDLPDGTYRKLGGDLVDSYVLFQETYDPAAGIVCVNAQCKTLPDRFIWKDGRYINH